MSKVYFILIPLFAVLLLNSCNYSGREIPGNLSKNIDSWHQAAGAANAKDFFGFMDSTCVYLVCVHKVESLNYKVQIQGMR